jgi:ribonucleotide monophosphatase NagD (HAD superfamily)
MIGDQLETDIAGANGCGIDSALITTGVSIDDLASLPEKLQPTWWIKSLTE